MENNCERLAKNHVFSEYNIEIEKSYSNIFICSLSVQVTNPLFSHFSNQMLLKSSRYNFAKI